MRIARTPGAAVPAGLLVLAVLTLTSSADARGFMRGVGGNGGVSGPILSLNCPSSGLVSVPSTNFTMTYAAATFNGTTNTISFVASPATGTFSPVSPITPSNVSTSSTFTFTPGATPTFYTITVTTNVAGLTVIPASCGYNATTAGSLALSGPPTGPVGIASSNFTVNLTGATFNGTTNTVTIADGSQGGTFALTSGGSTSSCTANSGTCTFTPASGALFTFTYMPANAVAITLTTTNPQGWSNTSIGYTGIATLTMTGPSTGTVGVPSSLFTVTLNGRTFNGALSVGYNDGGAGGTFSPVSPQTPPNLATNFTFTYTAINTTPVTISTTNSNGWINTSAGYTASSGAGGQNPLPLVIP